MTPKRLVGAKDWFAFFAERTPAPVLIAEGGSILGANPAMLRYLGLEAGSDLADKPLTFVFAPDDCAILADYSRSPLDQRSTALSIPVRIISMTEGECWTNLTAWTNEIDGRPYLFVRFNTAEPSSVSLELSRKERARKLLSASIQTLLRSSSEARLLQDVCDLCVNQAGYRMAWVGLAQNDVYQTVLPAAYAGVDAQYFGTTHVSWQGNDAPHGLGPTGTAIRTRRPCVMHNLQSNPLCAPWREAARQRGYHSSASFPLLPQDGLIGALSLYASEETAFDEHEIELLEELANDLAFGLQTLRREAQRLEAEENLRAAKEFLSGLLDNAPLPIYATGSGGGFVLVNKAWRDAFKFQEPLSEQIEPAELVGLKHAAQMEEAHRQVISLGKPLAFEERFHSGTERREYMTTRFPLRDADGSLSAIGAISLDVTDQKAAARAMRNSEQSLAEAQQIAKFGSWDMDVALRQATWSRNMYRIYDVDPESVHAVTVAYFADTMLVPEDRDRVLAALDQAFQEGANYDIEYRIRHRDGSIHHIWGHGRVVEHDAEGRPRRMMGTAQDITERKVAEEQLAALNEDLAGTNEELRTTNEELHASYALQKESEARYRSIVECSPDGICIVVDGKIVFANEALIAIHGMSSVDELLNRPVLDFVPPEEHSRVRNELTKVRSIGQVSPLFEGRLIRIDGSLASVELKQAIILWQGQPAIQFFIRDVTDRRKLEQQLRQMQKLDAIGTLAGGIAHDFNNILSGILGYADLVADDLAADTETLENLDEIRKAGQRAKDLVRQILSFSRQTEHALSPVTVSQVAKEVCKLMRASLPTTIVIRQEFENHTDVVLANPTELHQVLMNLCTNAGQAMPGGGTLEVTVRTLAVDEDFAAAHPGLRSGPHVVLSVADTGTGMSPEVLEHIFEPFFSTKVGTGTGLGLSVAYGIIKSMNGVVTVYSEPGRGTAFHVYIPQLVDAKADVPGSVAPHTTPRGSERILLVDDEQSLMQMSGRILSRLGYKVCAFSSSKDALETFREAPENFDLLFTDQTMPDMTGIRLAQAVLKLRPELPVVLATGYAHGALADEAQAIGITEFVTKPLVANDMAAAVRRALDKKRLEWAEPSRLD